MYKVKVPWYDFCPYLCQKVRPFSINSYWFSRIFLTRHFILAIINSHSRLDLSVTYIYILITYFHWVLGTLGLNFEQYDIFRLKVSLYSKQISHLLDNTNNIRDNVLSSELLCVLYWVSVKSFDDLRNAMFK